MKEFSANLIFILIDIFIIFISLTLAYLVRNLLESTFGGLDSYLIHNYISLYPLYIIIITLLVYEGIYTYRYDFWHESRVIVKSLVFSFFVILAYLAITKSVQNYSRAVIVLAFLFMVFLLPLSKNISKKLLYHFGLWQKCAKIYGEDSFLTDEIYGNPYLGYVKPQENEEPSTIFVNSKDHDIITLKSIISNEIKTKQEVIFIPLMDDYNLTHSHIYELSNTRTNLIVFQNRLKSKYRIMVKNISDLALSLILLPLLIPAMLFIAYQIKRENPNEKILFKQKRLGKNGKPFSCYKFQTMYENNDAVLQEYLNQHPEENAYYETYHKYKSDPRITKVGQFLRHSSLDELPQIFNVFRGDMSFIGPRPYMINEKQKIGEKLDIILTVKPGITGLWQISGRSDIDFYSRVKLDVWYIRNWNLWMDLVILFKTIKVVLRRDGAY